MTLRSRIRRAAGRAGRLKRVDRFVERREEYFLKFVTSLRLNCVVVNKEQYPECSSISEMDTKAAHYEAGINSGPNLTPSIARLSRVVYTARQLSCFSLSRPPRLFAHPLPLPHPRSPLFSQRCARFPTVESDAAVAAAAESVCLTHVRWKSINILH